MQITKAVITAAGRGARQYPASDTVQKAMLPLVDRDGLTKPVLQIIAEEALESGIEEICVVARRATRPSTAATSATTPPTCARRSRESTGPRSRRAGSSTSSSGCDSPSSPSPRATATRSGAPGRSSADEPFLLLLGDHLYISAEPRRCARQLIDLAAAEDCAVSAVQATREHLIHQYGTLDRPAAARASRGLRHRRDHREAEPDPGRAAAPGPRPPRGALPLLLRHARADARPSSTCSTTSSDATSASWARSSSRRP